MTKKGQSISKFKLLNRDRRKLGNCVAGMMADATEKREQKGLKRIMIFPYQSNYKKGEGDYSSILYKGKVTLTY